MSIMTTEGIAKAILSQPYQERMAIADYFASAVEDSLKQDDGVPPTIHDFARWFEEWANEALCDATTQAGEDNG